MAEVKRLRDENAEWMTKAQSEYILRMKAESALRSAQELLNHIVKVLNYRFGIDSWKNIEFNSSAFDACDSINAIDEIAGYIRSNEKALGGDESRPFNIPELLASLTKEQTQELIKACVLIADPLSQELIKKAII